MLALPPLDIGVSCEHQDYAGTLEFSSETAAAMWQEVGACVHRAGLRKLVLYNSHGGNHALAEVVARRLRADYGMLVVLSANLAQGMAGEAAALFPADEMRYGIHGGAMETPVARAEPERRPAHSAPVPKPTEGEGSLARRSLMLHLRPELVSTAAAADFASRAAEQPKDALLQLHAPGFATKTGWLSQDLNAAGVVGAAASLSDATKGAALADECAAAFAKLLAEVHAADVDELLGTASLFPPQGPAPPPQSRE